MPKRGAGLPPKTKTKVGADLARFAGVSENTIKNWRQLPDFPRDNTGATTLYDFAVWMLGRDGRLVTDQPSDEVRKQRMAAAELLSAEAKAVLDETKARAAIGELVDRKQVEAAVRQMCAYIRSRVQASPAEMASELPETAPTDPALFEVLCRRLRENLTIRLESRVETILVGMTTFIVGLATCQPPTTNSTSPTSPSTPSGKNSTGSKASSTKRKNLPRGKNPARSRGAAKKSRRN